MVIARLNDGNLDIQLAAGAVLIYKRASLRITIRRIHR